MATYDIGKNDCALVALVASKMRASRIYKAGNDQLIYVFQNGCLYKATNNYGDYDYPPLFVVRGNSVSECDQYGDYEGNPIFVVHNGCVYKSDQYYDYEGDPLYTVYGCCIYKCNKYGDPFGKALYSLDDYSDNYVEFGENKGSANEENLSNKNGPFYIGNTKVSATIRDEIKNLAASGDKLSAIKRVREITNCGLEDAKNFVVNHINGDWKQDNSIFTNQQTSSNASSPSGSTSSSVDGCYIATCVYGSYDCPQVWTLRRYRDYKLAKTWYGKAFIRTYYAISPTIVKIFGKTKWFKRLWKGKLDKMVKKLQNKGFESSPYEDINWR